MIRRVLFITRFLSGGGAERVISVLANALVEQKYDVGVLIYNITADDYPLDKRVAQFTLKNYEENSGNRLTRTTFRWKNLRKIMKEYHPDVILPFLESAVRDTFFASRGLNMKTISTVRNLPVYDSKLEKYFYDYIYANSTAVFLQTESQKQFFSNRINNQSFVVPNPVNSIFIQVGEKGKQQKKIKVIVTAGRLNPQKNHRLLIEAMNIVHKKHPECLLHIYGEGNEQDSLLHFIDELEAESYIQLKGRSAKLAQIYEKADLFVLSSDYEGMPNALTEAMAAGLPCIATDCLTGPKELIGNNQRGILVPVGDVLQMSAAMMEMIESPDMANKLGRDAHEYVKEQFSPEKIVKSLIACCEKNVSK